jgi:hypothetical protein
MISLYQKMIEEEMKSNNRPLLKAVIVLFLQI